MLNEYEIRLKNIFVDPQIVQSYDFISKVQLYTKDQIIFKYGDENKFFMVLHNGLTSQNISYIPIGIIQNTIKCLSDCTFRIVDEQQFEMLNKAKINYQKKILDFIHNLPCFKEAKNIKLNFLIEDYKLGQCCLNEQEYSKSLFIIYDGEFLIRKKWNKSYIDIGQVSKGEIINDYECTNGLIQQFQILCKSQTAQIIKIEDYKRLIDLNDFLKIAAEKFNHRLARYKRMTDFKSGNCDYQQPFEPEILPLRDVINRVQTSSGRQRMPVQITIDEEVKKKVQIKMGTYKTIQNRKRNYSLMQ
ncbi:unnamed protein product [Paramecium primaurelia]|uniref:Cyclic nucleotide-binding domain-containing protein n=1 Tax=Paramecium primaurelia TaxID=5886 RepID=A0A8S1P6V3_PARPR|nr:unnamed protein product [Paramecium primaurelia]